MIDGHDVETGGIHRDVRELLEVERERERCLRPPEPLRPPPKPEYERPPWARPLRRGEGVPRHR